ncbi:hypothetical protein [Labilithrix luteola]|uniref:hypothetical protein n=1 Tax=Labilithrix luteola TaxID=1391654 RepID=UPI0011BA6E3A|nr:hypothetical protein [Labilithrix luteola]
MGLAAAASAVLFGACTHDFGTFEGGSTLDSADASSEGGRDGASGDSGVDCSTKRQCATTQKSCNEACDSTASDCASNCGGSNSCRQRCSRDHDTCQSSCSDTCQSCAGPSCRATCS